MKETNASFILCIRHDAEAIPLEPLAFLLFDALDAVVDSNEGVVGYSISPIFNAAAGTEYMKSGEDFFSDAERAEYVAMHENPIPERAGKEEGEEKDED